MLLQRRRLVRRPCRARRPHARGRSRRRRRSPPDRQKSITEVPCSTDFLIRGERIRKSVLHEREVISGLENRAMRILCVMWHSQYVLRLYESALRRLASAGHQLHLGFTCIAIEKLRNEAGEFLDALAA